MEDYCVMKMKLRIKLLTERDELGNLRLINKLKRRIKKIEEAANSNGNS